MSKEAKEFTVLIPEEHYQILEFNQDDLPGIAVINKNLSDFEPKAVFSWHCSVMVQCENLAENGMPTMEEVKILDEFGEFLDKEIKGADKEKPNALFLARITWNETRELIWRVYDPEVTNNFLKKVIDENKYARDFDFEIEDDDEWKLAEWHLKKRDQ